MNIGFILFYVSRILDTVDEQRKTSVARGKKYSIFVALGRGMMTKFAKEEDGIESDEDDIEQGNNIYLFVSRDRSGKGSL